MSSKSHPETKILVLISGNGTNLQALIDACKSGALANTSISRVISNRKAAYGLTRARDAKIPTNPPNYESLHAYKNKYKDDVEKARAEYDKALADVVIEDQPDMVVCAGWMHVFSSHFLEPVEAAGIPVINLHPARPGEYSGANAIERAHKDFMEGKTSETGLMIHYVIKDVDMGEPILVMDVPLSHPEDDDVKAMEERFHELEHQAIVDGTRKAIQRLWEEREILQRSEHHKTA